MREWCAEQGKDPVASGLGDVTAVTLHCPHHQFERRVYDGAGFLRVEVLDEVHRSLDVGEQHGDRLAFAFKVFRGGRAGYSNLGLVGLPYSRRRRSQGRAALAAEFFRRLNSSSASRTLGRKRRTALGTEFPPFSIISSALGAAHWIRQMSRKTVQTKFVSGNIARVNLVPLKRAPRRHFQ